ncbi:MAG: hypothetical protein ACPHXR_04680 [Flavicella sp.]
MLQIHSSWAYLLVLLLLFTFVNAIIGFVKQKEFTSKDFILGLSTLIVTHIQLFIGLSWYFMSPVFKAMQAGRTSEVLADTNSRLLAIEHPLTMVIAVIFLTIGWSQHKKRESSQSKFKTIAIFYGIALLLILLRIPWKQWLFN